MNSHAFIYKFSQEREKKRWKRVIEIESRSGHSLKTPPWYSDISFQVYVRFVGKGQKVMSPTLSFMSFKMKMIQNTPLQLINNAISLLYLVRNMISTSPIYENQSCGSFPSFLHVTYKCNVMKVGLWKWSRIDGIPRNRYDLEFDTASSESYSYWFWLVGWYITYYVWIGSVFCLCWDAFCRQIEQNPILLSKICWLCHHKSVLKL